MATRRLNHRAEVRSRVWESCGGKCHHCGTVLNPFANFHLDHLVPLAKGGADDETNLVGSCSLCNLKNGGRGSREARQETAKAILSQQSTDVITGTTLRAYRDAFGLSQTELADLLNVPQNTISRWEVGKARILHPRILSLALRCLAVEQREKQRHPNWYATEEIQNDE